MNAVLSPPYDKLAHFAGNLATCLETGVGVEQSLKTASLSLSGTRLAPALEVSLTRVKRGTSLAEAFAAIEWGLPTFFVPMVQAGEQTGRTDEALRHLERHCRLLIAPSNALRNVWLVPLGNLSADIYPHHGELRRPFRRDDIDVATAYLDDLKMATVYGQLSQEVRNRGT